MNENDPLNESRERSCFAKCITYVLQLTTMTGETCILCGNTRKKEPQLSYHRFPTNPEKRALWLQEFELSEHQLKSHSRVCSRHFRGGDPRNGPAMSIGKRFASPIKKYTPRAKRANLRQLSQEFQESFSSRSVTPMPSPPPSSSLVSTPPEPPLTAVVGEQLDMNYSIHELPTNPVAASAVPSAAERNLIDRALLARIESLEAENARLKKCVPSKQPKFTVEQIRDDDRLFSFYTGFKSYVVFLAFFQFLGPAVNKLNYWGSSTKPRQRQCRTKLSPMDQLVMTLMKLRLNLKVLDLSFRFGVSPTSVSRYITTWICFLYHHLKEVDWMPSVQQVCGTLPPAFREGFATTYAIIDGSEIFLETPTDLFMQSSTWSSYKHHNTAKFLIACTPNGCICFISPLYVGSISDVEITRVSGFLTQLKDKPGISIMADRGFTIKDMLQVGIEHPSFFMEGRQQLPAEEVQEGRRIASVRIHVERAIGRIKTYKQTLPISLARLSNQIVLVCAYLSNFKPVLVPPESSASTENEIDVDKYFEDMTDSDVSLEEGYIDSD